MITTFKTINETKKISRTKMTDSSMKDVDIINANLQPDDDKQPLKKDLLAAEPSCTNTITIDKKDLVTTSEPPSNQTKQHRLRRIGHLFLFVSYILGILWTCLHPSLSILTGELKCRGWFLDEHSIEIRFVDAQAKRNSVHVPDFLKPTRTIINGTASMSWCDNLALTPSNVVCHRHDNRFDMVMVQPRSNALDATEEAVVVVLPAFQESDNSKLHKAMLQAIDYLADPIATPWLAKTVYIVTPAKPIITLDETVLNFLDAYLGREASTYYRPNNPSYVNAVSPLLPPQFSTAILRNLIVVNVTDFSTTRENIGGDGQTNALTGQTHLAILPQGNNGVLPNADLVFLVGKLLERTTFRNTLFYPNTSSTFLTHGYTQESIRATSAIDVMLQHDSIQRILQQIASKPPKVVHNILQTWSNDFINLLLFVRTLAFGPTPPHAPALDRGIDSLTIQVSFEGMYRRDPAEELIQYVLLYLVRALGNLHERLHHSFTLYWLPTPQTFVTHMEYFLPNVLLLLPLAIRAFGLLLPDIMASCKEADKNSSTSSKSTKVRIGQFVACVLAAYILVPMAFAHTALAYLPSMLVTPLLAFPDYSRWI
jgi:GPI-anchor transamidase subunit GAA1